MTGHELAKQLLSLPDYRVVVESARASSCEVHIVEADFCKYQQMETTTVCGEKVYYESGRDNPPEHVIFIF